jgi:hypothetical protein
MAPVGPTQYPSTARSTQQPRGQQRPRLCLLKGCDRTFCPQQPQQRYCRAACQQEAVRWRGWHSARTYRASAQGKRCRRQQAYRHRQRCRQQRVNRWEETLRAIEAQVAREAEEAEALVANTAQLEPPERRVGQRPAPTPEDFPCLPCRRPGCYVLFPLRPRVPQQRFCCGLCRQALRRVLDREARWRSRRQQRRRCPAAGPRSWPPPR